MNYIARCALCKCIGFTFPHDVVGAVDIGTDRASILRAVQAVSPSNPLPAKDVFCLIAGCVVRDRIEINKARFAGIALFLPRATIMSTSLWANLLLIQ